MNVVYVSYDGLLDPLGASQVLPYLLGLAGRGIRFTVLSFEKEARFADRAARDAVRSRLAEAGIVWRPKRYHKRPRLPATLFDCVVGAAAVRREVRDRRPRIVHGRGEVATTMARLGTPRSGVKVLHDVRGFFADERADAGSWRRGGLVDRLVRRAEGKNLERADGIVVLTKAALEHLHAGGRIPPHQKVIPTCVNLDLFVPVASQTPDHGPVYAGSFGARYLPAATIALGRRLGRELGQRALFVSPNAEEAIRAGATSDWADVRSARSEEVPALLRRGRVAFFLYQPGLNTRATSPTRLGEALASGLPVVTNEGVGDLDGFLESEGVGVLVRGFSEDAYDDAARRVRALLERAGLGTRCREVARRRLGLAGGVDLYFDLYRELAR